jgi:acetoin utilization deacetylase AcuC-like enzyme
VFYQRAIQSAPHAAWPRRGARAAGLGDARHRANASDASESNSPARDFTALSVDHPAVLAAHARVYLDRMCRRVPNSEQPLHATWASFSMGSLDFATHRHCGLQLDGATANSRAPIHSRSGTVSNAVVSLFQTSVLTPTTIVLPRSVTASFAVRPPEPADTTTTTTTMTTDDLDGSSSASKRRIVGCLFAMRVVGAAGRVGSLSRQDTVTDTFMSRDSWNAALLSAGGVCAAIDAVLAGPIRKVFVPSRPPGHHAARHGRGAGATSQGFCLLNNIAIGAFHALRTHNLERVVIFDTDVHSGNGTIDAVGGTPKILFCQLLAPFDFLPDEGQLCNLFTNVVNVTLTTGATKQGEHLHRDLAPVWKRMREFKPQIVLVSAGFDAHDADRLMNQAKGHLQDADFEILFRSLCEIADECCDGRLVAALEGGYTKRGLTGGVTGMMRAMMGVDEKSDRSARARTKRKTRH